MAYQFFRGITSFFYKGEFESEGVLGRMEDFIGNKIWCPPPPTKEFIDVLWLILGLPKYIRNSLDDLNPAVSA